ncbi:MAG: anti-sigma factor [Candidatus Eremiobacteraeota bacterium]|nr:anti-sigma factor [Candidatus Eremiobacteraeota bacterium]
MKDHGEWIEKVTARLEGTLSGEDLKEINDHLEGCEECRKYYEFSKNIEHAVKSEIPLPLQFTARVMSAIPSASLWRSILPVLSVECAFFLILFALSLLFSQAGHGFPLLQGMPGKLLFPGMAGAFLSQNGLFLVFYSLALFLLYLILVRVRRGKTAIPFRNGITGGKTS